MTQQKTPPREKTPVQPLVLKMQPVVELTDDQLLELSGLNRDLRLERTAKGELEVMPPTGGETGNRNAEVTLQLGMWARENGTGFVTDSSSGYRLPNGAVRSPDAAWIRRERLSGLKAEQKQGFLPLCPDFMVELRSHTDRLTTVEAKMREYLENGARLGWLIDPESRRVYVYRTGKEPERLDGANEVAGDPELPGFVLDLRRIWEPGL